MSHGQARFSLVIIFLSAFTVQAIALVTTYARGLTRSEELLTMLLKLLAVYSIHGGVIAGGVFGKSGAKNVRALAVPARVALILAALWNLLLVWRPVAFAMTVNDSPKDVIAYLDGVASASSFLVVGALAYFFSKQDKDEET